MVDDITLPRNIENDLDKYMASGVPAISNFDVERVPRRMVMDGMRLMRNLKIPFNSEDVYKTANDLCIDPEEAKVGMNVLIGTWALQHDADNFKENHYDTESLFENSSNPFEQISAFQNWLGGPAHDKPLECGPKVSELVLPTLPKDMVSDAPASPLYTNSHVKNPRGLV